MNQVLLVLGGASLLFLGWATGYATAWGQYRFGGWKSSKETQEARKTMLGWRS